MGRDRAAGVREHLQQEVKTWVRLLVPDWRWEAHYLDEAAWVKKWGEEDEPLHPTLAKASSLWPYRTLKAWFNVPVLAGESARERRATVIHELTHPILQELFECGTAKDRGGHLERVVSDLEEAFLRTADHFYQLGKHDAKKKETTVA